MRRFGLELEMGDLNLVKYAKRVFELQNLDFNTWQSRWSDKKIDRYDIWNVTCDYSLLNSNGTRCGETYLDKDGIIKKSSYAKNADRTYWQGAELVSPPYEDINHFRDTLQVFVNEAKGLGAIFKPELRHATQIHVNISDFSKNQVFQLLKQSYKDSGFTQTFRPKHSKYPTRILSKNTLGRIEEAITVEQMFEAYRTESSGKVLPVTGQIYRRMPINPTPWFKWILSGGEESIPTCEFRIFPSTDDVEQIVKWTEWCIGWINSVATYETCEERPTGEEIWEEVQKPKTEDEERSELFDYPW